MIWVSTNLICKFGTDGVQDAGQDNFHMLKSLLETALLNSSKLRR